MDNPKERAPLFSEFPPVSAEEWEEVIRLDLKGADYREKLRWETGEGVEVLPFYRAEDLGPLSLPSPPDASTEPGNEWNICQPVFEQDIRAANRSARLAAAQGADDLLFRLHVLATAGALGGDLEGTATQNQHDFNTLTEGIDLTRTGLHFDSGMASPILLAMLSNTVEERGENAHAVRGTLLYDPYAYTLTNGRYPKPEEAFIQEAAQMAAFCKDSLPGVRCLGVDAQVYHNAGATIVQELGYAMAIGNEYLATLTEQGLAVDDIASRIHFTFAIGSNYFPEIAKFRAARILWEMIVEAYVPGRPSAAFLHGRSSEWNKTVFDPHTNILRTTTEGMAAAIAGCDLVTLDPFDRTFKQPDDFSGRLARNTQIILKGEAYLNKVKDPSAGSYYVEVLTDKIAEAAWEVFKEIEQQGGILKSIRGGYVQAAVEESRRKRDRAIAERGRIFVGTNAYADAEERVLQPLSTGFSVVALRTSDTKSDVEAGSDALIESLAGALREGWQLGDLVPILLKPGKLDIRPIHPYRGPQAFEELRLATERHGSTPRVLTLPLGNKKLRKARSAFAVNFFSCAGYDIKDPIGFETVEEAVRAIIEQRPDVVVLCSSDEEYKQLVPELFKELNPLNEPLMVAMAGHPGEDAEQYTSAGVEAFIHSESNVLEALEWFQRRLGIITE